MTLAPLLAAPVAILVHTLLALAAFLLGAAQFLGRKGTRAHRAIGWTWVILLALVALSSFRISTICSFGPFSLIHLLSLYTLIVLPYGVLAARRHDVGAHKRSMALLYLGALVIAGAFTLVPGRIMNEVVLGTPPGSNACA
ncbi:DUF2306 domain-containing protein [Wenxinia saemankumensis]|uniref:Uncharacterized membrane protein n=1 Tax=Wenxinia saemankumensis TaxID=1447782 RepID=A0A1M6D5A9_9RHOB|nr:DUF2306 domain-containing protein [Wenxinia saemankumensis]SHI68445.1 Uncharacterized membrane protein [Wenxinia saemankumensis]